MTPGRASVPRPAPTSKDAHRCAESWRPLAVLALRPARLAACGGDERRPPGLRVGSDRAEGHRGHLRRRHGHAERRAGRGRGAASRSSSRSPPTRPARSTCTPTPEQELEYDDGRPRTVDDRADRPARASSTSSRTPWTRRSSSSKSAEVSPDGITLAHGIGGAKDLPISPELAIAGAVAALTVSFTVLAVAWRTPRYDAATSGRPGARPGSRALVDSHRLPGRAARRSASRCSRTPRWPPCSARTCSSTRSSACSTCGGGSAWSRSRCCSARSGRRSARSAPSTSRFAKALRQRPRPRRLRLPRAARLLAGGGRAVRVRVAGAGLPLLDRARPGAAVVRGVRRGDAARRRAVRQHASTSAADPFEVYSTPGRASCRSGAGAATCWWSAARWPTWTPSPVRPGLVAVVAVLFGSTAFDSFKDSTPWVKFVQGTDVVDVPAQQPGAAGVLRRRSGLIFARRLRADRASATTCAAASCRTSSRTRWCRSSSATSSPTT